jgi:hypothetical protein
MDFVIFLLLELVVAIPTIWYYVEWGIYATKKGVPKGKHSEILRNIKRAYLLTGFTTAYLPAVLLIYLYYNIFYMAPEIFASIVVTMAIMVIIFEIVNIYSFVHYEKVRMRGT